MADSISRDSTYSTNTGTRYKYKLPECYIYFYHTDEYFILPSFPKTLPDTLSTTFQSTNALSRTAPVYSYVSSGPRHLQVNLELHRDMMNEFNTSGSNVSINGAQGDIITNIGDDYIDVLIKKLQTIALPRYKASEKLVNPPRVALRFGNDVFIKGVVDSTVSITYNLPINAQNKYMLVEVSFSVYEDTPFDADSVGRLGSFRGLTSGLKAKVGVN